MRAKVNPWLFAGLILGLILFSYANQLLYHYAVPPGGDAVNHNALIQAILRGDWSQIVHYHTIFHLVTIGIARIVNLPSITVMTWLGPALLVTMALTLYFFNQRAFGPIAGITSLILIGFLANQPLQTLYDGGFPNVLASGTILPLVFILFDQTFRREEKGLAIIFFLLGLLILFFSHHLTTLYALPIILVVLLIQLVKTWRERSLSLVAIGLRLLLIYGVVILLLALLLALPFGGSVRELARQFMTINFVFPFVHLIGTLENPNAFLPINHFPNAIGEAIVYLGVGGFVIALYHALFNQRATNWLSYVILIVWAYLLLAGSQMLSLGFPIRLARDLAIPLALLAGIFVQTVADFITGRGMPNFLIYLLVGVSLVLSGPTISQRYQRAFAQNPLVNHLAVDSRAADFITRELPLGARVGVFQDNIYLGDFTPLHQVIKADHPRAKELVKAEAANLVGRLDYLYVEERLDREESWINNHGIVESYLKAPFTLLLVSFEQPEKKVYLFEIKANSSATPG